MATGVGISEGAGVVQVSLECSRCSLCEGTVVTILMCGVTDGGSEAGMFYTAYAGSASQFGFSEDRDRPGRGWSTLSRATGDQQAGRRAALDSSDGAEADTYDKGRPRYPGGRGAYDNGRAQSTISRDDDDLFEKAVAQDPSDGTEDITVLRGRGSGAEQRGLSSAAQAKRGVGPGGEDDQEVRASAAKEVEEDLDCKTGRSTLYYQRHHQPS